MTDQMFVFLCRDVRKHAFDFRRGDLQAAEERKVTDHLASCEKCRDYLDRLEGMLDAAAIQDYAPKIDRDALFGSIVDQAREEGISDGPVLDRDRLFDRITAEIDLADTKPGVASEALALAEPRETVETERDEDRRSAPVLLYVVAALAAGILMGIGLGFLYPTGPSPVAPPVVAEKVSTDSGNASPKVALALAELTVQPTPAEFEDVRVFGDADANWNIRTQGAHRKLEVSEGTLLVEFVPTEDRDLEFVADRFTVRVTGTIFYASVEHGIVGVVAGSVEVDTLDGETIKLVDGQEWVDGSGLRTAPATVLPDVDLHLDVQEHLRALELARADPRRDPESKPKVRRDAPRPPVSKEVVQTPREQLRESAERALRDGRHSVAAQYYERMVEELSAADPANASLRLDLARIYIRHLAQERRALVHLRRFVTDRPDDSLTPAARDELCRIATSVGSVEQQCQP